MTGTTKEAREIARAYVLNDRNRGIFQRVEHFSQSASEGMPSVEAAADFVLGEAFLSRAEEELDAVAPKWEAYVHTEIRRVLDAGCGPGATTRALARRYPMAELIGVDVEAPALALAGCLNAGTNRCTFIDSSLEDFAPSVGFDIIQCREVIEHVFDPGVVVGKLVSLLRPGGVAYLEMPNYLFPWEPHIKLPILPRSPKWVVRAECRLTGRDPEFVSHLNLQCTRRNVLRWIRDADRDVQAIDLMAEKIDAIFASKDRPKVERRAEVVDRLHDIPGAATVARWVLRKFPVAPSVMLLIARRANR